VNRAEKAQEIELLNAAWQSAENAYLLDYRGMKVSQVSELRRKVREAKSGYKVVKNRLAILAARETPLKDQETLFGGMTAVVWNDTDPVDLAKIIHEFAKTSSLAIKGGVVDGKSVTPEEVEEITKLPARPQLIAMFAGMIRSPMSKFVSVLMAPTRDFASVLRQVSEQKK
jgi:large subunit ribosomal protein L10